MKWQDVMALNFGSDWQDKLYSLKDVKLLAEIIAELSSDNCCEIDLLNDLD